MSSNNFNSNFRGINNFLRNDNNNNNNRNNEGSGTGGQDSSFQGGDNQPFKRNFGGGVGNNYSSFGGDRNNRDNNRDNNNNNNNNGNFKRNEYKPVVQIINEQLLTEEFTDCNVQLVQSSKQQQNQQGFQQVQQNYFDKLQVVFCNQQAIQIHSVEKTDQGMKLVSGGCTQIQNNAFQVEKCFVLKNLLNNIDASAFSIKHQQGFYGFTIITTDSQNNNQITSQLCQMIAHQQPIIDIFVFQATENSRAVNKIVTVSSSSNQDSNSDAFVKFWELQQNGIILDQKSTLIFKDNIEQWFNSKNIKLDAINNLQFTSINNKSLAIITFKKPRFEQPSQKQQTQANCAYILELEYTNQRPIQGQKIELGPATAAIQKMEFVINPKTNDTFLFASLRNDTRQRNDAVQPQVKQPQGFLYASKNLTQLIKVYENNFPLSDFQISFGTNQATIIAATTRSVQPITWNLLNTTFSPNKFDSSLQQQGDIQNVYLFKSSINLVEINQLLTVHYKGFQQTKKCITLSTLEIQEHQENPNRNNNNNFNNDRGSNYQNKFNNNNTNSNISTNNTEGGGGFNNSFKSNYNNNRTFNNNNNYNNNRPPFYNNNNRNQRN